MLAPRDVACAVDLTKRPGGCFRRAFYNLKQSDQAMAAFALPFTVPCSRLISQYRIGLAMNTVL